MLGGDFTRCPDCEEETSWIIEAIPLDADEMAALTLEREERRLLEAAHARKHDDFERYYAEREAIRIEAEVARFKEELDSAKLC